MDAITETQELKDEVELLTLARDFFKSIRCGRTPGKVGVAILAGQEEAAYQKRLDELTAEPAKPAKRK
jgi:hypothetical protein